jgi:hypothetical protein
LVTDKEENKLPELYRVLQAQLEAGLAASRKAVGHPVAVGDATESNWLSVLQEHLPHRYQVQRAFVVDSQGWQSEQLDIVVYDHQYTPALYNRDGQRVIPAESVYAVMEVKQTLDKGNIDYAGSKAASVRKLHRTSAAIVHAGGRHDPVEPRPLLAGILTTDCSWNPPFGDPFENAIRDRDATERLDIGCCAGVGAFNVSYHDGVTIEVSPKDTALAFFFFRLLHKLQQVGTVPAIDYSIYLDALAQ